MSMFPPGTRVTISSGPHTGKKGKVRGWTDLAPKVTTANPTGEFIHVVDLDEPFFVPDGTPNPPEFGPSGPTGRNIHGDSRPDQKVDWVEVPGSGLTAST